MAMVAATIANTNRHPDDPVVTVDDVMPDWPARFDEEDEPDGDD